jgi:hypothetical protein
MSERPVPWWFFGCTAALAAALNAGLPAAWSRDPSNRFGGLAMALWLAACFVLARKRPAARLPGWILALVLLVLGQLGSLQVLKHAALALLLASVCPGRAPFFFMALAAFAWTPAWGWIFGHAAGSPIDAIRPVFVAAAFACAFLLRPARHPSGCPVSGPSPP